MSESNAACFGREPFQGDWAAVSKNDVPPVGAWAPRPNTSSELGMPAGVGRFFIHRTPVQNSAGNASKIRTVRERRAKMSLRMAPGSRRNFNSLTTAPRHCRSPIAGRAQSLKGSDFFGPCFQRGRQTIAKPYHSDPGHDPRMPAPALSFLRHTGQLRVIVRTCFDTQGGKRQK